MVPSLLLQVVFLILNPVWIFVLFKNTGRRFEIRKHDTFPFEEIVRQIPGDNRSCQHAIRSDIQLHERRQEQEKSDSRKSVYPDCEKAIHQKQLKLLFPALRGDQISKAGNDGVENQVYIT